MLLAQSTLMRAWLGGEEGGGAPPPRVGLPWVEGGRGHRWVHRTRDWPYPITCLNILVRGSFAHPGVVVGGGVGRVGRAEWELGAPQCLVSFKAASILTKAGHHESFIHFFISGGGWGGGVGQMKRLPAESKAPTSSPQPEE